MTFFNHLTSPSKLLNSKKNRPQMTLFGAFPEKGNCGDEAAYISLFQLLESIEAQLNIRVLSSLSPPELWNFTSMEYYNQGFLKELDQQTTFCLVTGGGIFNKISSFLTQHIQPYLQEIHKPFAWLGVGVDTNVRYTDKELQLLQQASSSATLFTTRNSAEAQFVKQHCPSTPIQTAYDCVYWLKSENPHIDFGSRAPFGLALRDAGPNMIPYLAKLTDALIEKHNRPAVFIPLSFINDDDSKYAQKIMELMKHKDKTINIQRYQYPTLIQGLIQNMKFMICMRLHGAVMAHSYNVPLSCIGYHSKITNWLKDLNRPDLLLFQNQKSDQNNEYNFSFNTNLLPSIDDCVSRVQNSIDQPFDPSVAEGFRKTYLSLLLTLLDANHVTYNKEKISL